MWRAEVDGSPPYRRVPALAHERAEQEDRLERLRRAFEAAMGGDEPLAGPAALGVRYRRSTGAQEAPEIVAGIAEALAGVAYLEERQIRRITYDETAGDPERYEVVVAPLMAEEG